MTLTLAPLPPERRAEAAHLTLAPDQDPFIGDVAVLLAESSETVDMHAFWADDTLVGVFKIDRAYPETYRFAAPGELGLRGFMVGKQVRGPGYARAALAALPGYLAATYDAAVVLLTVNCRNPVALRAGTSGGWTDTGALYHGGAAGPQRILRLALPHDTGPTA